jgi:hypothetical protein
MADEQPQIPSTGADAPDVAATDTDSEPTQEGSSPGWWQRLFNRRPAAPETEPDDGGETAGTAGTSSRLTLTQEELDKRIQAETDRREAKRAADARAAERRRLRDEDPFAFAQQERDAEQQAEHYAGTTQFFQNVGLQHDRVSIDPLMEALPVAERQRIMQVEGAGHGLEGRKVVVNEALKALERHWKAEGEKQAEAKLRRNSAFRKQVLAENRDSFPEPELLPAYSGSTTDRKVSEILRGHYGLPNPSRHNSAS